MASGDRIIIAVLKLLDAAFQRQILKDWVPLGQKRGLPQSGHAPVSIRERMDEHEFTVEHRGQDQRMYLFPGIDHPAKQRFRLPRNQMRRRSHEDALIALENPFVVTAEHTGFLHGQMGHDSMQPF